MRERALAFGCHINIEGAQEAGMTVTVRIPPEQACS